MSNTISWEDKIAMVQLGNKMNGSTPEAKAEFHQFVLSKINDFDGQAWDMFCNIVNIVPDEMKEDKLFWQTVYKEIGKVNCGKAGFGFRSGIRIELIKMVCEDDL